MLRFEEGGAEDKGRFRSYVGLTGLRADTLQLQGLGKSRYPKREAPSVSQGGRVWK